MRPGARRGGRSLLQHLKANLTKAAEQGSLTRRVLLGEEPLELRTSTGDQLVLGEQVREVHPVVVTLDDLSAVAPVLWQLAGSKILPSDVTVPWVVTLHELDLICQVVRWPAQFVHFLRRRSLLNARGGRLASDELDWWMLYLETSLYFEGDVPRGHAERYLSLTDPLDAWVLSERGVRSKPAPKPSQDLDQYTATVLDRLTEERPPAWMAAGCSLLDVSGDARKRFHRDMRRARQRAMTRGKVQRGTLGFEDAPGGLLLCWVVVPDDAGNALQAHLHDYVLERLDDFGIQRVLGLGVAASSKRPYDALLVNEHQRWDPTASD